MTVARKGLVRASETEQSNRFPVRCRNCEEAGLAHAGLGERYFPCYLPCYLSLFIVVTQGVPIVISALYRDVLRNPNYNPVFFRKKQPKPTFIRQFYHRVTDLGSECLRPENHVLKSYSISALLPCRILHSQSDLPRHIRPPRDESDPNKSTNFPRAAENAASDDTRLVRNLERE